MNYILDFNDLDDLGSESSKKVANVLDLIVSMFKANYFCLECLFCCLLLPIFTNAQQDTTRLQIKHGQTYQPVGLYNQRLSEIPAFNDYEAGMTAAKNASKPALIYFNAYGAIPARKFDEEVLSIPEIRSIINSNFQLIVLILDDPTILPIAKRVQSKHLNRILKTIGDFNIDLQITTFGNNRQPMFYIVESKGKNIIASTLAPNTKEFQKFLSKGRN
jgi:hypothetical protein